MVSACSGMSGLTDSMKDQQWFSRSDKLFNQVSIEAPPLTPVKAVTAEDLMSQDGSCAGMAPPAEANALADASQPAAAGMPPAQAGGFAIGSTECAVARAAGVAPDNVNLSADPRGERLMQITYLKGPRPGAYTFKAGRLTAVERVDVPEPPKPARQAKAKKRAT
jgi:hypothetical protein